MSKRDWLALVLFLVVGNVVVAYLSALAALHLMGRL